VPLESLVGAQERIERLAAFIVEHWEKRRAVMEGKAMVVTMSRDIAARLYEAIRTLRPDWHDAYDERGAMKVVVTGTSDDPEPLRQHVRTKATRKRLAERFKAPDDDLRLVIVCDMWLTGFDCPPAHTMYLDKPLAGHSLMQAIARVNRVYGDKGDRPFHSRPARLTCTRRDTTWLTGSRARISSRNESENFISGTVGLRGGWREPDSRALPIIHRMRTN
jgi:type I site-specific restriction-modification system R (restriction) subunit